jgi:hypothetical protein
VEQVRLIVVVVVIGGGGGGGGRDQGQVMGRCVCKKMYA